MVFFTCQHCGDSLKKAVVERHYNSKCFKFPFLTCVDCLKDFKGTEYKAHTSCITEDEKYSAKGFVPKPSSNKQLIKQVQWIDIIKEVLTSEDLIPRHRNLLKVCSSFTNVPRKLQKFQNFVNNISKTDQNTITEVHALLQKKFDNFFKKDNTGPSRPLKQEEVNGKEVKQKEEETSSFNGNASCSKQNKESSQEENKKLLTKKELKKKRKQEKYLTDLNSVEFNNEQKEDKNSDNKEEEVGKKKKRTKKRTKETCEDTEITPDVPLKKKKKNRHDEQYEQTSVTVTDTEEQEEIMEQKLRHETCHCIHCLLEIDFLIVLGSAEKPFNWNEVIIEILKTQENKEMSLKKLRKKVISEYQLKSDKTFQTYEQLLVKFNKKVNKTVGVRVHKEIAKLKKNIC